MNLADVLIKAIEANRVQLNAEVAPFVGRVPFHVDLDVNISMCRVQVSVRPCRDPCPEAESQALP